jgi:uncharacterized protein (DUF433 family)
VSEQIIASSETCDLYPSSVPRFDYTSGDEAGPMARRQQIRLAGDLRDYPRYSIEEAAQYLKIPATTLTSWTRGYARTDKHGHKVRHSGVILLADPHRGLLSFFNLAEAYVLRFARNKQVSLRRIRLAVEYIRSVHDGEHPLLHPKLATTRGSIFIRELGLLLNASRHGQLAMKQILAKHLSAIKRGSDGLPEELAPLANKVVSISPFFSSGEPVIAGTGIMVSTLVSRTGAGDSPDAIARDYGLDRKTIEQAVKAYRRPQAA